jgi:histidyl-tRNA synthetase
MMVDAAFPRSAPERSGIQAIALGAAARERLIAIAGGLRAAGLAVFMDYRERKLFDHFKFADRNGARWALILGDDDIAAGEIVLRDLERRSDRRLPLSDAVGRVAATLVEGAPDA